MADDRKQLPGWIQGLLKLFSSQAPEAEVNLSAYAFGVLAAAAWLTWWFYSGPRDGNLVAALAAFLTAVTGGLFKKGSNAAQQAPGAGETPRKDGEA